MSVSMALPGSAALWAAPIAGLLFGSFAALAGYRMPRGEGVVGGRSRCPSCGTALSMRDLVPVVSWLILRGRCVVCKVPISPRYPVTELGSAGLFALVAVAFGESWSTVTACALALGLVIIVLADLDRQIIPDLVLLWLLPTGLVHRWLVGAEWSDTAAGAVIALAFGLSLRWLSGRWAGREALGLGDVKLLGVAGAWLGIAALPWFLMAAGALGAVFAALWQKRYGSDSFPLGPALSVALFAGVLASAPW